MKKKVALYFLTAVLIGACALAASEKPRVIVTSDGEIDSQRT